MAPGREYDIVVFGATGYAGKLTAENIAAYLPTDIRWAVAGRSQKKLEEVVAVCRAINPDRIQPSQSRILSLHVVYISFVYHSTFCFRLTKYGN
jgi:hypothetical protein